MIRPHFIYLLFFFYGTATGRLEEADKNEYKTEYRIALNEVDRGCTNTFLEVVNKKETT